MKLTMIAFAVVTAATALLTQPALGAQETHSARVCFTGSGTSVAASPKDWGYSWVANGNGVALDGNKANDYFLTCVGFSSMSAGKRNNYPWTCTNVFSDGSTLLTHGITKPNGTTQSDITSGTGRYKGATGTVVGSKQTSTGKAPKGMFASCRDKTTFTINMK